MKNHLTQICTFILGIIMIAQTNSVLAQLQDENKTEEKTGAPATFSVGADLVSRYIWREALIMEIHQGFSLRLHSLWQVLKPVSGVPMV
jgi:hypothetical protein